MKLGLLLCVLLGSHHVAIEAAYTFTDAKSFFADTFHEADAKFSDVCTRVAGAENLRTYTHPTEVGKQGEALTSRVCLLGPRNAPNVLYSLTGVHGAEGFSGSAAMPVEVLRNT